MASLVKRKSQESKASKGKRKRRLSGSDEEGPAFLSSKYAEPPVSKIYNSHFRNNTPAELFRKDLISAMKLPDSEPLTPEDFWPISDSWKPEWEKGVQVPVNPEILPKPNVKILRPRRKDSNFKIPKKLLHLTQDSSFSTELHILSSAAAHAEKVCRYDMDDIDMQWLNMVNEEREDFGLQPVEERVFELIMEELEAMCYDNFQEVIRNEVGLGSDDDDDAICDVCRSPDSEEGNEMVFCDSCNVCVHQACYGITKIPEGSWICRTCALGLRPSCVLCPNKGGAMKSTRSGEKWAHVSCALWIPEVTIGSVEKMEPIIKISQIPVSRWTLVCSLCKEKTGACIQCSVKFCKTAYHVTCAFEHGLQMKAILEDNDDEDGIKLQSYCPRHSKKRIITSSDSEPDFVIQQENARRKKELQMTNEEKATLRQQKIQECESQFYNYVDLEEISGLYDVEDDVTELIMNYWKLKRKANFNRPLLPPKAVNHNSSLSGQNSKYGFIEKILNLRQDLERARNLCYMVSKREKLSRSWVKVKQQIFQKQHEAIAMCDENSKLTKEEMDAVLLANHGDSSYDKKYTGLLGPSPSALRVLTALMGQEHAKTELNKICKFNKKNEKSQSQKLPKKENNPYAKHYLNGLLKRSQRWLASIDRQKMVANPQSFREFSSSQCDKSDTNSHFGDVSKNSISASDLEGFESLPNTNDSDLSFLDFSETATNDNESSLPLSVHNAGDKCFSDMENHLNNANKDNHRSTEKKLKGYLGSSSMKSLVSSQIKKKFDSVTSPTNMSSATPKLVDETSKSQDLQGVPSVLSKLSAPCLTEIPVVKCETLSETDKNSSVLNDSGTNCLKEESNSNSENTAFINQLSLKKKSKVKQEHSVCDGKDNPVKHKSENSTVTNSLPEKQTSQKIKPDLEKSEDMEASSKEKLECRQKVKYLNGKKNRSSKANRNAFDSKDGLIKDDSGSLHVYNNAKKLNSGKEIVLELTPICKVMDITGLNVPEMSSEVEVFVKSECDSPLQCNDAKDINVCQNDTKNKLDNVKSNKRRKNDSFKVEEPLESSGQLETDESTKNKKSAVLSGNSKCNKYQKNKMSSSEIHSSESSTVSSISHSSPHSTESDGEPARSRKKSTASGEMNSTGKIMDHVKVEPSDTNKSKALSSSELKSSSSSSVNKPHTTSSSTSNSTKLQKRDSSEKDKSPSCNKGSTQAIISNSTIPSKGSLSGYKIPKKVKTLVGESSLEKKRGSSPLSPLADCMASTSLYPSNSYQVRHSKPWRSNQRNQQNCPNLRNGETESQSQRLVIKLKKDPSDPDSQRWKTDSTYGDRKETHTGWADDVQPTSNSVQRRYRSPDSRQWTRVPGVGCSDPRLHDVHYGSVPHMT